LPAWDGTPVAPEAAVPLLAELQQLPRRVQRGWLVRRCLGVLGFVAQRRSADGLDDHLQNLALGDQDALDESYALIRFITWAIPILGFLGTVLGITQAIAGVTPEKLEANLSSVTDGLATAFDATALGLGLTMGVMFLSFLVERVEHGPLAQASQYAEQQLAHRFARPVSTDPHAAALHEQSEVVLQALDAVVRQQVDLWRDSLREMGEEQRTATREQQALFTDSLCDALEQSLAAHEEQLTEMRRESLQQTRQVLAQ